MKFLFDFFPVVAFYVTYKWSKSSVGDVDAMIYATGVLMAATCIQVVVNWVRHKKIENMHIVVLVLALIFGGATIYLRDPIYLIWKVTLANWLFALAFGASHFIGKKPLIKRMLEHAVELPDPVWTRLNLMWIGFFIAIGILNLIVAEYVTFNTWTDFKLWGVLGLTIVFVVLQSLYLGRHVKPPATARSEEL